MTVATSCHHCNGYNVTSCNQLWPVASSWNQWQPVATTTSCNQLLSLQPVVANQFQPVVIIVTRTLQIKYVPFIHSGGPWIAIFFSKCLCFKSTIRKLFELGWNLYWFCWRPYKRHFQNWQFDVSLLENFGKKVYLFHHFFQNFSKIHHNHDFF